MKDFPMAKTEPGGVPLMTPADEAAFLNLVMQNCAKAILAAADLERLHQLYPDNPPVDIVMDGRRAELGRELGRLTALISRVMSAGIADSDFGTEGMTRGQAEANALMAKITKGLRA